MVNLVKPWQRPPGGLHDPLTLKVGADLAKAGFLRRGSEQGRLRFWGAEGVEANCFSYFPWLVLKGIYHYWKYVLFLPGKWKQIGWPSPNSKSGISDQTQCRFSRVNTRMPFVNHKQTGIQLVQHGFPKNQKPKTCNRWVPFCLIFLFRGCPNVRTRNKPYAWYGWLGLVPYLPARPSCSFCARKTKKGSLGVWRECWFFSVTVAGFWGKVDGKSDDPGGWFQ